MKDPSRTTIDVLIVGAGPTGAALANLLGLLGVKVVVIDKQRSHTPHLHSVYVDQEALRNIQATGLLKGLIEHGTPVHDTRVVDAEGELIFHGPIDDTAERHGFRRPFILARGPLERALVDGLSRFPHVELLRGTTVTELTPHARHATVDLESRDATHRVEVQFVVGCDGHRGTTRQMADIQLSQLAPPQRWLTVEARMLQPVVIPIRQPLLWTLTDERLIFEVPNNGDRRRWHIQLLGGEVPSRDQTLRWLSRLTTPDQTELLHLTVSEHPTLIAETFRRGRILLAGDAAHVVPPAFHQGLCAGLGDVTNLAFKLARVVQGRALPSLLDTYSTERRQRVQSLIGDAVDMDRHLKGQRWHERWRRDLEFKLASTFLTSPSFLTPTPRRPTIGFLSPCTLSGQTLPQVVVYQDRVPAPLDDVLGYRFALIARPRALDHELRAWAAARSIPTWTLGIDLIEIGEALLRWLDAHEVDLVLVRPDRIVFGAERARDRGRLLDLFDRSHPITANAGEHDAVLA